MLCYSNFSDSTLGHNSHATLGKVNRLWVEVNRLWVKVNRLWVKVNRLWVKTNRPWVKSPTANDVMINQQSSRAAYLKSYQMQSQQFKYIYSIIYTFALHRINISF